MKFKNWDNSDEKSYSISSNTFSELQNITKMKFQLVFDSNLLNAKMLQLILI